MSDYNINKMNFKQLRNEVQLLRDELAIFKRKYEDIIYNLDTDNFSSRFVKEQDNMRTAIEVTAEGIKTKVSNEEFESAMTQTASEIRSVVSKNISVKFESSYFPTKSNTTDAEKGMLCEYNGTLYYYNDITETWKEYPYADGIMSQFLQTAYGFELTGDVSISGDLITGGTISGSALKGGSFWNSAGTIRITLGGSISSDMGDLTLSTDDGRQIFQVYDDATITDFKVKESSFLASTGTTTYAYGTWDFTNASVTLSGGVAVFG